MAEGRDAFSRMVNEAAFAGEITYITRGRNHVRAAAVVPAEYAEFLEALIDQLDGQTAMARLEELRTGRAKTLSMSEIKKRIGM